MIKLRPHHFLCTLGFEGKGYSPAFIRNYFLVQNQLQNDENELIEVVEGLDSVCSPCPNHRSDDGVELGICRSENKIQQLDQAHSQILSVRSGDRLSWKEAKSRIKQIDAHTFHKMCEPCAWKNLGICERALNRLKEEQGEVAENGLGQKGETPSSGRDAFRGVLVILLFLAGIQTRANTVPSPEGSSNVSKEQVSFAPVDVDQWFASKLKKSANPLAQFWVGKEKTFLKNPTQFCGANHKGLLKWGMNNAWGDLAFFLWMECAPYLKRNEDLIAGADLLARAIEKYPYSFLVQDGPRVGLDRIQKMRADIYWKVATDVLPKAKPDGGSQKGQDPPRRRKINLLLAEKALLIGSKVEGNWANNLSAESVRHFAEDCSAKPTTVCKAWAFQLYPDGPLGKKDFIRLKSQIALKYKATEPDVEAWKKIWDLYITDRLGEFFLESERFFVEFSKSEIRHKVRYWWAKVLKDSGRDEEKAKEFFKEIVDESPLSYYGLLASWQLGLDPAQALTADSPKVPKDFEPVLGPGNSVRFEMALGLLSAGSKFLAGQVLRNLPFRDFTDLETLLVMIEAFYRSKTHSTDFFWISELLKRGYKEEHRAALLQKIFPLEYREIFEAEAGKKELPLYLVLGLTKQESAFEKFARSTSNAVGLMQLLPMTAKSLDSEVSIEDLERPEINISLGSQYLKKVADQFGGNFAFTTAGYNAGPSRMKGWQKMLADYPKDKQDFEHFVELIPFKETQGYVSTIFRNIFWYAYLAKDENLKTKDQMIAFYFKNIQN